MTQRCLLPSVLSADLTQMRTALEPVQAAGADMFHVDVMDGHFVPNLTLGFPVIEAVRAVASIPLDVHLMVSAPLIWVERLAQIGVDAMAFHLEATPHWYAVIQAIRNAGCRAGVALNPGTPLAWLEAVIEIVDYVVVMTVNPGFSGQTLITAGLDRVRKLRDLREREGLTFKIEIDGGIKLDNVADAVTAGADWFVVGSGLFKTPNPAATTAAFKDKLA